MTQLTLDIENASFIDRLEEFISQFEGVSIAKTKAKEHTLDDLSDETKKIIYEYEEGKRDGIVSVSSYEEAIKLVESL